MNQRANNFNLALALEVYRRNGAAHRRMHSPPPRHATWTPAAHGAVASREVNAHVQRRTGPVEALLEAMSYPRAGGRTQSREDMGHPPTASAFRRVPIQLLRQRARTQASRWVERRASCMREDGKH